MATKRKANTKDQKAENATILTGAFNAITDVLGEPYRAVSDIVPGGKASDEVDAAMKPAMQALERFVAKWRGGRP